MSDPQTAEQINRPQCGQVVTTPMKPFKDWTQADVDAFNAKSVKRWTAGNMSEAKPVDRESDLHDAILEYCRAHGWAYIHSRMDRKTTTAVGVADFVIFADLGRVFVFEAKRRNGKLSPAQQAFSAHLARLGHTCRMVQNMEEFRKAVE